MSTRSTAWHRLPLTLAMLVLFACQPPETTDEAATLADPRLNLALNDVQVFGSHNSYKEAIAPALLAAYSADSPETAASLDYWHPSLTEQLDLGLRKLELDVFYDPDGGRYAEPSGFGWAEEASAGSRRLFDLEGELDRSGFKVLHVQDLDFRSNCSSLTACLLELRAWSEGRPGHLPVVITVNTKDQVIERDGFVRPLPFDAVALRALDAEILRVLGSQRLITPDNVRRSSATLAEAVVERGWPTLQRAAGRFLWVLDQGGEILESYLDGDDTLAGRVFFVNVPLDHPASAVRILNDPVGQAEEIAEHVRAGRLVRTRADANTEEARTGDVSRRKAAFASGAQFVSTDYYLPEQSPTDYLVSLPGSPGIVARCLPQRTADPCEIAPVEKIETPVRLIAHRGGVVDEATPENSRAAIEKAVAEGYWMVEVDLRLTADGEIVAHHDETLSRIYGDSRRVDGVKRVDLEALRMRIGGEPPLFFDELLTLLRGRLQIMLDFKTPNVAREVFVEMADTLEANDLLDDAYVIGSKESRAAFEGRARVGVSADRLESLAARGGPVEGYFFFRHGRDLTSYDVLRALELRLPIVPSVNLFHYADLKEGPGGGAEVARLAAKRDLDRLSRWGVTDFQIDSVYGDALSGADAP
ncbi:MAG: Ca2+-dependent phosphoinositide-specific phospholipase C [Acidobacteriota bacterium]